MKILTELQAALIIRQATRRLAEYIKNAKLETIILGVSGGIDSAVVGAIGLKTQKWLMEEGYPLKINYSFLDVHSNPQDLVKAMDLASTLGFNLQFFDLSSWYDSSPLLQLIPPDHPRAKIAQGNIKCRLRMIALYHFAQLYNGIYIDTDDLSEYFMGFWTRHGDEGDVKIIQELTKAEVYDLGEFMNIPYSVLSSKPGDGLGVSVNNLATDQLGLPYMEIDYIISRFLQNGFDSNGQMLQLSKGKYINLMTEVSEEIDRSQQEVHSVLKQCLRTAFKRKYGENVSILLPLRLEMDLPVIGSDEFNELYLNAIKRSR
ncbi:MAG TPA: NAD(+) synthase [Spirochaetia bacterium]|nr:NAD(+) synthase [Spirochaetia bacterium]